MKRRGRDLIWLVLILCIVALGVRRLNVSHDLDGQTYEAQLGGYAGTILQFKDGAFELSRHTCTSDDAWHGSYRIIGKTLYLSSAALPASRFEIRRSAGRIFLDSAAKDFDRTLKLAADGKGGPHPPRWGGGQLRLSGIYPGMELSSIEPKFQLTGMANGRAIYRVDQNLLAFSAKDNRVLAVGGTQLSEKDGRVLLEAGERIPWIEECLGQTSVTQMGLCRFPCGLSVGHGYGFRGGYFLGDPAEVDALRSGVKPGSPAAER